LNAIEDIIDDLLAREGGFVNQWPDRGGATNFGITRGTLSAWLKRDATVEDVKNLPVETARDIYRQFYYIEPGFACIDDFDLLGLVVDSAVQHGTRTVIRWLQRACDVVQDGILGPTTAAAIESHGGAWLYRRLLAIRIGYYFSIIADSPAQAVFAKGWFNRIKHFIEDAP
jgi:lysozyme family protein